MAAQTSENRQESQHTNPIEINRRPTDRLFIFVYLPLVLIWLGISVSGFFARSSNRNEIYYLPPIFNAPVIELSTMLPVSVFLCLALVFLCLVLYEKLTKVFTYIFCVVHILSIFSYYSNLILPKREATHIIEYYFLESTATVIFFGICALPFLVCMITSVICFFKVDNEILCDIIKNCCGLMRRSYSLICFSATISILILLVISFTLQALIFTAYSDLDTSMSILFCNIIILGVILVISFISNFAHMVLSEYTINYIYEKNEKAPIAQRAITILRYHIGTIMFSSTIIIPFICSIVQALKHKPSWKIKENYFIYIVTKMSLVLWQPDLVLIFSAIYGTTFINSYRKTFDAVLRCCSVYMAMQLVVVGALQILCTLAAILLYIFIIIQSIFQRSREDPNNEFFKTIIIEVYGISFPLITFLLLITSTMKAQLIDKIMIFNKEDRDFEDNTNVHNQF